MKVDKILLVSTVVIFLLMVDLALAQLSENQALPIAQKVFEQEVPSQYASEYRLVNKRTFDMTDIPVVYEFWWNRFVNNIPVDGDRFFIWIDGNNGEVLNKGFSYNYPASELDITPTLAREQVIQIALNAYGGQITTAERDNPYLVIKGKELLWMVNLQFAEGRLWLGLDADTGETKIFNPTLGLNVQQVSTHFTPPWYQPILLNWQYAVAGIAASLLALAGIFIYFKRKPIAKSLKKK